MTGPAYAHRRIDYDDLRRRWDGPMTTTELGNLYGVSSSSISSAAKKMDLPPRRRGWRPDRGEVREYAAQRGNGDPVADAVLTGGAWLPRGGTLVWVPGGSLPAGSVLRDEAS